jgi:hypothetical protein
MTTVPFLLKLASMSPMLLNILIFVGKFDNRWSNFPTKISIFSNIGDIEANLSRNRTVVIRIISLSVVKLPYKNKYI